MQRYDSNSFFVFAIVFKRDKLHVDMRILGKK